MAACSIPWGASSSGTAQMAAEARANSRSRKREAHRRPSRSPATTPAPPWRSFAFFPPNRHTQSPGSRWHEAHHFPASRSASRRSWSPGAPRRSGALGWVLRAIGPRWGETRANTGSVARRRCEERALASSNRPLATAGCAGAEFGALARPRPATRRGPGMEGLDARRPGPVASTVANVGVRCRAGVRDARRETQAMLVTIRADADRRAVWARARRDASLARPACAASAHAGRRAVPSVIRRREQDPERLPHQTVGIVRHRFELVRRHFSWLQCSYNFHACARSIFRRIG